ncbi:hypothetical protein ACIP5Y_06325 [Nocardia sp. NPDC088792]|uniref:TRADD-N-associated membrane domain-containing protein n=1 Tax=Nocardia sp. NPDC088792 TaxID=3364332 RepID=UPI003826211C
MDASELTGILVTVAISGVTTFASSTYAALTERIRLQLGRKEAVTLNESIKVVQGEDITELLPDKPSTEGPAVRLYEWVEAAAVRRSDLDFQYYDAACKQQKRLSVASFITGGVAMILVLAGLVISYIDGTKGLATGVAGVLPGLASGLMFWQARAANSRADRYFERLTARSERAEAMRISLALSSNLSDSRTRDRIAIIVALASALPSIPLDELMKLVDQGNRNGVAP